MISDNSYLWALKLERNRDVVHTCTTWQVIAACAMSKSLTTAKLLNATNARSKVRSTRHNAVRHDGQLGTPFYGVTSWPCDELTGSRYSGYQSTCHTHTHTRLITQSTRHKRAHNKTTSTSRNYLHAARRHPETVLNRDGVITAICVTLMYTADYRSRRQITLLRKARSTRHNAVKHDGQLVTRFYDATSWPCDELTGSCYSSY